MAKICEQCGKTVTFFSNNPYYLPNDKILCWECAKYVRDDLEAVRNATSEAEYSSIKERVIRKSQERFNEKVAECIISSIDNNFRKVPNTSKVSENKDSSMFGDIGGKIKGLAQVVCWIGIIASVISGLLMLSNGDYAPIGIIIMLLGSLVSWVSSFTLYGFGELIDNSSKIVDLLKK